MTYLGRGQVWVGPASQRRDDNLPDILVRLQIGGERLRGWRLAEAQDEVGPQGRSEVCVSQEVIVSADDVGPEERPAGSNVGQSVGEDRNARISQAPDRAEIGVRVGPTDHQRPCRPADPLFDAAWVRVADRWGLLRL